jgi:hypothetical protein
VHRVRETREEAALRVPDQVGRLAVVTVVLITAVLVVRFVVVPRTLSSTPLHEATTIQRELAEPIRFGGAEVCGACHVDQMDIKLAGYHKSLACETCHGPAADHAENPEGVKPYAPRDRSFCPKCHAYDAARPTGFPQINPTEHNPVLACITCHNPHDPVPPQTPQECSACHAQIAHTKAVSAHALLACTTCHDVSEQHRVQPRSSRPTKPTTRAFCGQCHAPDATGGDSLRVTIPRVDPASHGGAFLCWQCHYPHLPEGNR